MYLNFIVTIFASLVLTTTASAQSELEGAKFEPKFRYRLLSLNIDRGSAFNKEENQDNLQQLHISLLASKEYEYSHRFVIEPVVRTRRTRFDDTSPEIILQQGYMTSNLSDSLQLTAGLVRRYEGAGLLVNPSDLANERRNLFDPLYSDDMYTLMEVSNQFDLMRLSLGFLPERGQSLKESAVLLGSDWTIGTTSLTAKYHWSQSQLSTYGLSLSTFLADWLEVHTDTRYQVRQRGVAEEREREFSEVEGSDHTINAATGGRFIVASNMTVGLEYIYNQAGLKPAEFEVFFDHIRTANDVEKEPDNRMIGREYIGLFFINSDIWQKLTLETAAVYNIQDESGFFTGELAFILSPLTSVRVQPLIFWGERDDEFGEMPFSEVLYLTFEAQI